MADLSYFTSERFIHDDLVREAKYGLPSLYNTWSKSGHIDAFVLSWPSETVEVYGGYKTNETIPFDLPKDRKEWPKTLREIVKNTKAYALLLVEQRAKAIVVILESPHGAKSWHIPITNHGNVDVLGDPVEKTDADYIGLLWSPSQGRS